MKQLPAFFLFFSLFAPPAWAQLGQPPSGPWVNILPADAQVVQIQSGHFRDAATQDQLVVYLVPVNADPSEGFSGIAAIYTSSAAGLTQIWKKSSEFRLDGEFVDFGTGEPHPILLLSYCGGASAGCTLEAYIWNGETFQMLPTRVGNWGFQMSDLHKDGGHELIVYDRYTGDHIYIYKNGDLVQSDADFPEYYKISQKERDRERLQTAWLQQLRGDDPHLRYEAVYGLRSQKLRGPIVARALATALQKERDPKVQRILVIYLSEFHSCPEEVIPALTDFLSQAPLTNMTIYPAVVGLATFGTQAKSVLPYLESLDSSVKSERLKKEIDRAIGQIKGIPPPSPTE